VRLICCKEILYTSVNCTRLMEDIMTYSEIIVFRLKKLCEQKGISINKLATLSGMTQSTLNNIMKGNTKNPKLKTLHKLAMGLDMTVSELLDFSEMNETLFDDE